MEKVTLALLAEPSLTPDEVESIERGLPSFEEWSSKLLVPVALRRLRYARVLWLNARWFLERHIDVEDLATSDRVCRWVLNTFAYAIPRAEDGPELYSHESVLRHTDRYGSSGGLSPHGGSGRAVIAGKFQAKGIGVTPLVGPLFSETGNIPENIRRTPIR